MRSVVAPASWAIGGAPPRLTLTGELRTRDAAAIWAALHARTSGVTGGTLDVDLAQAADVDGTVMALLVELRDELARRGVTVAISHAGARVGQLVHLYGGDRPAHPEPRPARRSPIAAVGAAVAATVTHARRSIEFAGELVQGIGALVRHP
ncbi:MAG TPA: STAS domain-containing protein, partial [Kofleriaceae bacterium]